MCYLTKILLVWSYPAVQGRQRVVQRTVGHSFHAILVIFFSKFKEFSSAFVCHLVCYFSPCVAHLLSLFWFLFLWIIFGISYYTLLTY
jgi:hypothetical protein